MLTASRISAQFLFHHGADIGGPLLDLLLVLALDHDAQQRLGAAGADQHAARIAELPRGVPVVTLATAHPANPPARLHDIRLGGQELHFEAVRHFQELCRLFIRREDLA
mgnify:CR=1 FL=1